jgi:hypothetical protein
VRAARTDIKERSTITSRIDSAAVAAAKQRLGWRVYATNQRSLSLVVAIKAYRGP